MPTTSAIVVNHQGGESLRRCIASLIAQEPAIDEVLVVDNASSDGSTDDLPAGVRLLARGVNDGFGAAVAAGLEATSSAFVWIQNADTVMQPGCHATACAALDADPGVGAVAPRVLVADDPTRIDASAIGLTSRFGILDVDHGLRDADVPTTPRRVLGPLGGAGLWRRAALERMGGFATWYFLYWEDVDAALRLDRAGYACVTAPTARVLHEGGGSVGRLSPRNVYQMTRNHWPCLVAAVPGRLLLRHPLRAFLAPLRATWLYAQRGRGLSALAGLVVGALRLPLAWARRTRLPRGASGAESTERIAARMAEADADRARMKAAGG